MKKYLFLTVIASILIGSITVLAGGGQYPYPLSAGSSYWSQSAGALNPLTPTDTIGSSGARISNIFADAADITNLTISGASAGNLAMGGFNITGIGTITFNYSSSTIMSSFQFASTTKLTQGGRNVYSIWKDRMSIASATTTDETLKFGTCLQQGGPSVTVTGVSTLLASSTRTDATVQGFTWNVNIANTTSSGTPMTLFTTAPNSYGTSSVQQFTPTGIATIPSGYCYWLTIPTASTSQMGMVYINLYGYEN